MTAGIDEAGRGPVIGPLVICLAELKKTLTDKRIKDSKLLKRKERLEILKETKAKFHYKIFKAKELVKLMQTKSLTEIELIAMKSLVKKTKENKVIIDCPTVPKAINKTKEKYFNIKKEIILENKADYNYKIVSLASIAAKEKREFLLDKLKKKYGDFGSGYPSDPKTKEYLKTTKETKIIRTNWKTWKNIKKQREQTTLQ